MVALNNLSRNRLVGAFGAIGIGSIGYAIVTYFVIDSSKYLPFALILSTIGVIFLITSIAINSKKLYPDKQ